jgi:hypothetical protein
MYVDTAYCNGMILLTALDNFRPIQPEHPFSAWSSYPLSELPVGFTDLCLNEVISRPVIMILKDISRLLPTRKMRNRWLKVSGWGDEDDQQRNLGPMDMLLLQGLRAFCLQHGFKPPTGFYWVSYRAIKDRLISISDADLTTLAEDRCIRDALVWIYVCVAGALHSRMQNRDVKKDDEDEEGQESVKGSMLLLKRVFALFENPKHLWWGNIVRTLQRFWLPARVEADWKQCWYDGIRNWRGEIDNG